MEAKGERVLAGPMLVWPSTTAWLTRRTPAARVTLGPTVQKGPISTSSASWAPGATMAVG